MLPAPRYNELGVKPLWAFIKEVPELLQYFPILEKDELPDRSFMWTILSTLRYDEWKQLIKNTRNARSKSDKVNNDELIEIDPEFLNKLIATPILSTGKQRILKIFSIYFRKGKSSIPSEILQADKISKKEAEGIPK